MTEQWNSVTIESEGVKMSHDIEKFRELVEERYRRTPTTGGGSFGEIICFEFHT